jgi:hypothetical protein
MTAAVKSMFSVQGKWRTEHTHAGQKRNEVIGGYNYQFDLLYNDDEFVVVS